jgi:hypothetical protein
VGKSGKLPAQPSLQESCCDYVTQAALTIPRAYIAEGHNQTNQHEQAQRDKQNLSGQANHLTQIDGAL